jgi:hypothetical protein
VCVSVSRFVVQVGVLIVRLGHLVQNFAASDADASEAGACHVDGKGSQQARKSQA